MKRIIYCFTSVLLLCGCFGDVELTDDEKQLNDRLNNPAPSDQNGEPGNTERMQLYIADARFAEGNIPASVTIDSENSRENQLLFVVSLNRPTEQDLTVFYQLDNGLALAGVDYRLPDSLSIVIKAGQHQGWIAVDLIADNEWEITKDMRIRVSRVEPDIAEVITAEASGIIANDDETIIPLSDTSSGGSINADGEYSDNCEGPYAHLLDCSMGHDSDPGAGANIDAERFYKLDNDGNILPANAVSWSCVQDNQTGLVWEAKQDLPEDQYHSIRSKFTVVNSRYFDWDESYHPIVLSGSDGILSGIPDTPVDRHDWRPDEAAEKTVVYIGSQDCANPQFVCTSEQYALEINYRGLCGFNDWHVPDIQQLSSIMSAENQGAPDDMYFPFPGTFISHTPAYNLPAVINNIQEIQWDSHAVSLLEVIGTVDNISSGNVVAEDIHGSIRHDRDPASAEKFSLILVRKDDEE